MTPLNVTFHPNVATDPDVGAVLHPDGGVPTSSHPSEPRRRGERFLETRVLAQTLYQDLRSLAAAVLAEEWTPHSLQPTALAHETFIKLLMNIGGERWETTGHFLAAAGEAMRRVLVDTARRRKAIKRGGSREPLDIACVGIAVNDFNAELVLVNDALDVLAVENPVAADVVRLRYFGGFTVPEIARLLGMPIRTVERRWTYARAWLGSHYLDTREPLTSG